MGKDENGNDLIHRFEITNKKADLEMLYEIIESIKSKTSGNTDVVFGMEATGIYSLPLYSALKRNGHKVKLYNPIQTNGFRKMNNSGFSPVSAERIGQDSSSSYRKTIPLQSADCS